MEIKLCMGKTKKDVPRPLYQNIYFYKIFTEVYDNLNGFCQEQFSIAIWVLRSKSNKIEEN